MVNIFKHSRPVVWSSRRRTGPYENKTIFSSKTLIIIPWMGGWIKKKKTSKQIKQNQNKAREVAGSFRVKGMWKVKSEFTENSAERMMGVAPSCPHVDSSPVWIAFDGHRITVRARRWCQRHGESVWEESLDSKDPAGTALWSNLTWQAGAFATLSSPSRDLGWHIWYALEMSQSVNGRADICSSHEGGAMLGMVKMTQASPGPSKTRHGATCLNWSWLNIHWLCLLDVDKLHQGPP